MSDERDDPSNRSLAGFFGRQVLASVDPGTAKAFLDLRNAVLQQDADALTAKLEREAAEETARQNAEDARSRRTLAQRRVAMKERRAEAEIEVNNQNAETGKRNSDHAIRKDWTQIAASWASGVTAVGIGIYLLWVDKADYAMIVFGAGFGASFVNSLKAVLGKKEG